MCVRGRIRNEGGRFVNGCAEHVTRSRLPGTRAKCGTVGHSRVCNTGARSTHTHTHARTMLTHAHTLLPLPCNQSPPSNRHVCTWTTRGSGGGGGGGRKPAADRPGLEICAPSCRIRLRAHARVGDDTRFVGGVSCPYLHHCPTMRSKQSSSTQRTHECVFLCVPVRHECISRYVCVCCVCVYVWWCGVFVRWARAHATDVSG